MAKCSPTLEEVAALPNLRAAFLRARRGKRHQDGVARFELELEPELIRLRDELLAGTYRPGA